MASVPYQHFPMQPSRTSHGTGHEAGFGACLRCGVSLVPFDVRVSGLLDTCVLMQSLLLEVRRQVEAMVFGEEGAALQDEG